MTRIEFPGIGRRIAQYRKINGMTADELSKASGNGLTRAVIANIETGRKTSLSVAELFALSVALGVPPTALLHDLRDQTAETAIVAASGRNLSVREFSYWLAGALSWPRDLGPKTPAGEEVGRVQGLINAVQSARGQLQLTEQSRDVTIQKLAEGSDYQGVLDMQNRIVQEQTEALAEAEGRAREAGIRLG